ncbi:MAG: aminotransferase class V-fold PLP-dependent enzyme [bacterium]|nr:aminotransferase class V-fold PLP-dependent enzyme [bacterium]
MPTPTPEQIAEKFAWARSLFPHTSSVTYLNTASYGPICTPIKEAIDENMEMRLTCRKDDTKLAMAAADELRHDYAALIGAETREVGIGLSTTFGINIAAFGLPLQPGDEVLLSDVDFPVNIYCWRAAAENKGLTLKYVPSHDRMFSTDELVKAITPRSKVLAISYVQFFNGFKCDLVEIGKICREHGLYFVVDGIQGMGAEPINMKQANVDIFAVGCQKWMLSPQGSGFFYISDRIRSQMKIPFGSWLGVDWGGQYSDLFHFDKPWLNTAKTFEMGYYAVWNILGMKAALGIFKQLGIENIQRHNHALLDRLIAYLKTNPLYQITSSLEERHRSSIVSFTAPKVPVLHRKILDARITLVQREGSIRVSAHLFNNEADIDRLVDQLEQYSRTFSS